MKQNRWFKIFLFFIAGFFLICFLTVKYFSPSYSGHVKLSSLSESGKIFYDNYGIPHIQSKNRSDLYKMFGYAVAQDRMFQIQLQKMIASGRLSEWFGEKTIDTDTTIRILGIKHYTTEWYKRNKSKLNPQLLEDLNSWLLGVNSCIKTCPKPLELVLLRKDPEEINVEDVLAFSGIMSFSFSKAYYIDAISTKLFHILNNSDFKDFIGEDLPVTKKVSLNTKSNLQAKTISELDSNQLLPQIDGSQSWVISPQKSESGFATLANDPHIAYSNPGVWYEAHLKSNDFELYGYFIPIIPFALIGNNTLKAWALTMSNSDEIDLIQLDHAIPFTNRPETILVRNKPAVTVSVKDSVYGPVINQILKTKEPDTIMSWDYFRDDNFVVETFFDLANAEKIGQFYEALKKGRAPGLNISWADHEGNIAWKILGYFPKRQVKHWIIKNESESEEITSSSMKNSVNDHDIPQVENPAQGYILSANQKPPFHYNETLISGYWDSSERYNTLNKVFNESKKISIEDQQNMFNLNEFDGAKLRLKKMLNSLPKNSNQKELITELENWDGYATSNNTGIGFYYAWVEEIGKILLTEKLTDSELEQICSTSSYWKFIIRVIDLPLSNWWNNKYSEILQNSFTITQNKFQNMYGPMNNWKWEKIHQLTVEHPMGKAKILSPIFNLGPYPVEGGFLIPNAYRHKLCSGNFNVTSGASTRRIVDFKNPKDTLGILPTGNSGVIFSPHYKDQVQLYLNGKLRSQTLDWEKIKNFKDVLVFNL